MSILKYLLAGGVSYLLFGKLCLSLYRNISQNLKIKKNESKWLFN